MKALRVKSELSWQQVDDEVVILDLVSSQYLSLNSTGASLWHRIVEGTPVEQLSDELVSRFDLSPSQAHSDVIDFIAKCKALGLLE